jgi:peptidoglycan/xylan/chitin deacetylase (PgdA/CDA1 family)
VIRRWGFGIIFIAVIVAVVGAGWYGVRRARSQTPLAITGPNILPNNDFSINEAAPDDMPDGWQRGATGVQLGEYTFQPGGRSMQLLGIGNYLQTPWIAARPRAEYRLAFRALSDSASETRVRVLFHWRDAEGIDFSVTRGEWQPVPSQNWNVITAAARAPDDSAQLSISIHPASDDRVYIDDLSLGQVGVRVEPWPDGKRAALAFSFDYETAMGGLIHSRSVDDPNADNDPVERGLRMREGADVALDLFAPHDLRATFYTNGYNFLFGNTERRAFMGDPVFAWANTEPGHDWRSDQWTTRPWFSPDPHTTEDESPAWYFGSQVQRLIAAGQDIQSHTYSHFHGNFVTPDDWRADFAAWKDVAATHGIDGPSSLAFPWSSSAGMSHASWQVLAGEGIRSVTRTAWTERVRRSWVADRERWSLRSLPGHDSITVVADSYLTPNRLDEVRRDIQMALLNEGAIDLWAHTEEVTSEAQIDAWQAVIDEAARDFWVAPVPEIVRYAQDIRRVVIDVESEQPQYRFRVRNAGSNDLRGVTLTLPFAPERVEIDGESITHDGTRLTLDLARGESRTITLHGDPDARESARASLETRWGA